MLIVTLTVYDYSLLNLGSIYPEVTYDDALSIGTILSYSPKPLRHFGY